MPKRKMATREQLTPFARELQDWLAMQRNEETGYLGWTHAYLADRLRVARGTVDAWFRPMGGDRAPTLPGLETFHAVQRITGWSDAKMLELTGYAEKPPYEPSLWEYINDKLLEHDDEIPGYLRGVVRQRLDAWRREYETRPRRPARRSSGKRPANVPASENAPEAEPAPTPTPLPRRQEPATAGK